MESINISQRIESAREIKVLRFERIKKLQAFVSSAPFSLKKNDYQIELFKREFGVDYNRLGNLLFERSELIEAIEDYPDHLKLYNYLQVKENSLTPSMAFGSIEHRSYVSVKKQYLISRMLNDPDRVNVCGYLIENFYLSHESKAIEAMNGKETVVEKKFSDKIIDDNIEEFRRIISLLEDKETALTNKISSKSYDDDIQIIDAKIECFEIKSKIKSYENFIQAYQARKDVI